MFSIETKGGHRARAAASDTGAGEVSVSGGPCVVQRLEGSGALG